MPTSRSATGSPPVVESDRVRALLQAHREITAAPSLPVMLERIVAAARDLVAAGHGAIGVLATDGSIDHLVPAGARPQRAVLGGVAEGEALLVGDLATDPRRGRLPAAPGMRSFLGVPLRVRGVPFGELYLTDPEPGRFDDVAADLVTALAASAGTAIENARLVDQTRRNHDWLAASGAVARALLADEDEAVLLEVVSRSLDVAEADYAALILPTAEGKLTVAIARGIGADDFLDQVFEPSASPLGRAILAGRACATERLTDWARPGFTNRHRFGPALVAPLADRRGTRGAVLLVRRQGRPPFRPEDVQQAGAFATQVTLALELNEARGDVEWLRVVEDRHRVARDLHDSVMQRLFATGVGLQALAAAGELDPAVEARLRRYVADLDQTIEQIRVRVFGLRGMDESIIRNQRGRYPHVPSPAGSGASRTPQSAESGGLRTLGNADGA